MNAPTNPTRRVAISLEMDWGYKRHLEVHAGCQRYADEAGWQCLIHPAVDRLLGRGESFPFDGVIARATAALTDAARKKGVPLVNVWNNSPVKGLPGVFPDWKAAGVMAAEHLLSRGFRNFGYLGYQKDVDSQLQWQGFHQTVAREGHPCGMQRFSRLGISGQARGWETFVAGINEWIDTWQIPVGVLVCQDLVCRYLIDLCRAKNLNISEHVAIVGTHNESEICLSPAPSLTSIDMSYGQVGYRAAALLEHLMAGGEPPEEPLLVAPAELIPRQSTDSCAADDPLVTRALRFIADHSKQRIQVKDVAAAVSASRRTLERRFRDSLGRAIADEITRLRLELAKRRIVETDALLKDVARESGFRTADHFYKVFTRVEGMPPTLYREAHQKAFPKRV